MEENYELEKTNNNLSMGLEWIFTSIVVYRRQHYYHIYGNNRLIAFHSIVEQRRSELYSIGCADCSILTTYPHRQLRTWLDGGQRPSIIHWRVYLHWQSAIYANGTYLYFAHFVGANQTFSNFSVSVSISLFASTPIEFYWFCFVIDFSAPRCVWPICSDNEYVETRHGISFKIMKLCAVQISMPTIWMFPNVSFMG